MKKDIESRLKILKKKMGSKTDSELTYTIQHMDIESLTTALIGCKGVTREEIDKIRKFAIQAIKDPNSPIADEFLNLSFVKAYMSKKESSRD